MIFGQEACSREIIHFPVTIYCFWKDSLTMIDFSNICKRIFESQNLFTNLKIIHEGFLVNLWVPLYGILVTIKKISGNLMKKQNLRSGPTHGNFYSIDDIHKVEHSSW